MDTCSTPEKPHLNCNGEGIRVEGAETISLSEKLALNNCLFVPALFHKLLSLSQLTRDLDCIVLMKLGYRIVQDVQTRQIIGRGIERGGLYYLEETVQKGKVLVHGSEEKQLWTWHRRLGHPSIGYLEKLFPALAGFKSNFKCETCVLAKSYKYSYSSSMNRANFPFILIHSDVWGPAPETGMHGFSYYVSFIDDCTRMSWIYFLKHKSEVFEVSVDYYNL